MKLVLSSGMGSSEFSQKVENQHVRLEMQEGILYCTYKKGAEIDLETAKMLVEYRLEHFPGNYPVIVWDEGVKSINKQARDYFGSAEGNRGLLAAAMVLNSSFSRMIGNFILKISSPEIPARIFTEKDKAIRWAQKFIKQT